MPLKTIMNADYGELMHRLKHNTQIHSNYFTSTLITMIQEAHNTEQFVKGLQDLQV